MKILFYGTRDYDQIFFDRLKPEYPDIEFTFLESNLYKETASLTAGYRWNLCVCKCRSRSRSH